MHKQYNIKNTSLTMILSLALLTLGGVSSASASTTTQQSYAHCNGSNGDQNAACNSSLNEHTYNLVEDGVYQDVTATNSRVNIDGVNIALSAFSDTQNVQNESVVGANLEKISDTWAYGVTNNDEARYQGGADHAIDNLNYYSKNSRRARESGMTNVERDYDFVLLSFDETVTLTGAGFSWLYSGSDSQVSVAALQNTTTLMSGSGTWGDIVADSLTSWSFDITQGEHLDHHATFNFRESAQYWILGAYNTVFGNIGGHVGNDAFKLANVQFSTTQASTNVSSSTQVAEPSTVGLLMACSFIVIWRRKSKG